MDPPLQQYVILFYKYHPLSKDPNIVDLYRSALESLCQSLHLRGRILVGCNEHQSEGINGTLSGRYDDVQTFTEALIQNKGWIDSFQTQQQQQHSYSSIVNQFWDDCQLFYQKAGCPPLIMKETEFKWSSTTTLEDLFPDLNIKLVKEMIGTGGVLASIPLEETARGYLTPREWHQRLQQLQTGDPSSDDTVLIDCRNTKEWQIGHFPNAIDPNTTTFHQFPQWVQDHATTLANKKTILMYCTGGIRCEKASAYIRRQIPSIKEVCHLQGGIHKYLDEFGSSDESLWLGKNFVFDGRVAAAASNHHHHVAVEKIDGMAGNPSIVGTCTYCSDPYDSFDPRCVCTVCREPTLVCPSCQATFIEFHCRNHQLLRHCYFTDLSRFGTLDLQRQWHELQALIQEIAVGRRYKQKRKTLAKQCEKIQQRLEELKDQDSGQPMHQIDKVKKLRASEKKVL